MSTILDCDDSPIATPRLSDTSMPLSRRDRKRWSAVAPVVRDENETETESEGGGDDTEEAEYEARPSLKRKPPPPAPHPNPPPQTQPALNYLEVTEHTSKRQRSSSEGSRPKYQCAECPVTYGRHKELIRHMTDVHNNDKRAPTDPKLTCKQCGILFSRTDALARHVKNKRCR
ncbi:UNVERIFIED_CONTAM: hypothetical protein HDU68_003193 [Siphonaria sp. JEL0065]|nr:hypothetical protein HDU68_003193 [Siphonaria sp. JEL0065]